MIRHHVQKDAAAAVKYYQLADYLAGGEGPAPSWAAGPRPCSGWRAATTGSTSSGWRTTSTR